MAVIRSVLWIGPGEGLSENGVTAAPSLDVVWVRSVEEALALSPGSFEADLFASGHPRLVLDLREVREADPDWGFLAGRRLFRNVGGSALTFQFREQTIREDFDLLVWIERTSAAVELPRIESD